MVAEYVHAQRKVLMLDYDGTLAPLVIERERALAYPGVWEVLNRLMLRPDLRLVIITGRALADIKPLLRLAVLPEIIASHGWERRAPDGQEGSLVPPGAGQIFEQAAGATAQAGYAAALERKPAGLALHWRGQPAEVVDVMRARLGQRWAILAQRHQLNLLAFDGGLELRLPGQDKGQAVRAVLAGEPALGQVFAAYLGDDATDEDAFVVLREGGWGILVRRELRSTAARLWVQPPEGLLALLECLCGEQ